MPKKLYEIKNFHIGTITTPSDADIPENAANSSLNIDAMSEDGILKGARYDRIIPIASAYGTSTTANATEPNGEGTLDLVAVDAFSSSGYITFVDSLGYVQVLKYTSKNNGDDTLLGVTQWHGSGTLASGQTVYQYTSTAIEADRMSLINDGGTYKGVVFDDSDNLFKKIDNIHGDRPVSSDLSGGAETHSVLPTMINNNKELHVGMGGGANDEPKWIGMISHGQYGDTAPATMQIADAKLLSPNSIPDFHKPVSDGTHIYGFEYGSDTIWKLKISDYSITKRKLIVKDNAQSPSFTAICMGSDNNLWVIDTSNIDYSVSGGTYQKGGGALGTSFPIILGTWMRIERETLTISKSGLLYYTQSGGHNPFPHWNSGNSHYLVTDILEKGSYLWISGGISPESDTSSAATYATQIADNNCYMFAKATSSFASSGDVTLNGDALTNDSVGYHLRQNGGSDERGAFEVDSLSNDDPIYLKIPRVNLVEIADRDSVVGILVDTYLNATTPSISRTDEGIYDGSSYHHTGAIIVHTDIAMVGSGGNTARIPSEATYEGGVQIITESSNEKTYDGYMKGVASAEGKLLISVQDDSTTTNSELKYASQPNSISGTSSSAFATLAVASTTYDINEARPYLKDNSANVDIHLFSGAGSGRWMSSTNTAGSIGADIFTVRLQSEMDVTLTETTVPSAHTNTNKYYYKFSYVYDGYQESPLGDLTSITSTKKTIDIDIKLRTTTTLSQRISGIAIYMAEGVGSSVTPEGFYRYVDTVELDNSFTTVSEDLSGNPDWGSYRNKVYNHNGIVGASYEARIGISEILENTIVNYGLSTDLNNQLFVADCYHAELNDASNYLFKSRPYNYDQFNYVNDFLILPLYPTAIASFNNRIFIFDENNILRIEPNNFYIESSFNGIGCLSQDSILVTEYGMCFVDRNSVYLHDGQRANDISISISRGDSTYSWENIDFSFSPKIAFSNYNKSFLITFKTTGGTYFTWEYNIIKKRWDLQRLFIVNTGSQETAVPKDYVIGKNGEIIWNINGAFYTINNDKVQRKSWDWTSKEFTLGQDTQIKRLNNFSVAGSPSGSLGTNVSIKVDGSDVTETAVDGYNNFILSDKSGKKVQWILSAQTGTVDALGIIYRLKIPTAEQSG